MADRLAGLSTSAQRRPERTGSPRDNRAVAARVATEKHTLKADRTVQRHLKELRALVESTRDSDPLTFRIAVAMETAVRWAREDVVSWPGLVEEAQLQARILKVELEK